MYKAIIFDLDNTLINRQQAAYHCYKDIVLKYIPHIKEDQSEVENAVQYALNCDEFGHISKAIPIHKLASKYEINEHVENEMLAHWYANFASYTIPFEGSKEVVLKLKEKYKLGILTNGTVEVQGGKLKKLGYADLFDAIVISGEDNIHKPELQPYEKCCKLLGVKREECIFVGDTFHTDIIGAIRANMFPVWLNYDRSRPSTYPIIRIYNILELLEVIEGL